MPVVLPTGYQHSLSEIRTKVRNRLMQTAPSNSNWTDGMLNDYINDALKQMLLKGLVEIAQDTFTTTADMQTWVPAATVWKIVEINYDDDRLREITRDEMNIRTDDDWDRDSGDWETWFMDETQNDRRVTFDKKAPSGKRVDFWFWRCPQDMVDDNELVGVYRVLSPLLVEGALWLAYESDGNLDEGRTHKANFLEMVPDAQMAIERLHESDVPQIRDWVGSTWNWYWY